MTPPSSNESAAEPRPVPTPDGVVIDRVSHEDIPEICALYKRVWETHRPGIPSEFLKTAMPTPLEFTSRMEGLTYFVAREEKKLRGIVGCTVADGSCRLADLAVDTDVRRKGIATALVLTTVDWARKSHASAVWVDVLDRFSEVNALLHHLGFDEAGVMHKLRWNEDVRFFEMLL